MTRPPKVADLLTVEEVRQLREINAKIQQAWQSTMEAADAHNGITRIISMFGRTAAGRCTVHYKMSEWRCIYLAGHGGMHHATADDGNADLSWAVL